MTDKFDSTGGGWTFFSNHAHVLVCLALKGDMPLREVAMEVGITERAAQRIVRDLADAGVIGWTRVGRVNHYHIERSYKLRHPLEQHASIGDVLSVLIKDPQE